MNLAPPDQAGLALGAWGAVQASAAGIAVALGGIIRDMVAAQNIQSLFGDAAGYAVVYTIEILLMIATIIAMSPLLQRKR
jgi:BCD family chlorophyll transporter-like MFS transporter